MEAQNFVKVIFEIILFGGKYWIHKSELWHWNIDFAIYLQNTSADVFHI